MASEGTIYAERQITQVIGGRLLSALRTRIHLRMASRTAGSLPIRIDLIADQIFPRLPFSNQSKLVATNERLRR